jgi:phosphoenolpyruvate-protein kinase (PTS system EI component)
VKQAVREADSESVRELAEQALELSSAAEVRRLVAGETVVPLRSPAS